MKITSSRKIAIALLALVVIFFVAGPAAAGTSFHFYLTNKTNNYAGDDGTKLKVNIYHYKNSQRGSLQKSAIVPAGEYHSFSFHFSDCSKTKHREYDILPIDSTGAEGAVIGSGRIRMKTSDLCNRTHMEYQGFAAGANPGNYSWSRTMSDVTDGFYVTVKCGSAGNCED